MLEFLLEILNIDSTSGQEENVADYIYNNIKPSGAESELQLIPNGKKNVFFKWGSPEIIFCSHFDTVPPYIPPRVANNIVWGRGSCDAKGQIAVMYETCNQLYEEGNNNFGLLMLAGEETGSYGAITANKIIKNCKFVIVGEPTENKLIKAAKGNLLVEVGIAGKASHSGYPDNGDDAIEKMRVFLNRLEGLEFPDDEILGKTTYNIGLLDSHNAHNVVPDSVTFKIFFRTTFASNKLTKEKLKNIVDENISLKFVYGDPPIEFMTVSGIETGVVSYGSDAPELYNLGERLLYGPGTILTAHTENEHVKISKLDRAVKDLKMIYHKLNDKK